MTDFDARVYANLAPDWQGLREIARSLSSARKHPGVRRVLQSLWTLRDKGLVEWRSADGESENIWEFRRVVQ